MAQINDYASLVSAVSDYPDRAGDTAFTGRIDSFIGLAEDSWTPMLLNRAMEVSVQLTTASDGSVSLPSDFYRYRALYGTINGAQTNLPMVSPVAEQGLYPIVTGDTPLFAKIVGSTLYVIPENQVLTVTLDYWAQPLGLTSINTTNWIILTHPTLYFYAVMAQACLWMQDFAQASSWGTLAQNTLDQITDKFGPEYYQNTDLVLDTPTP